MLGKALSRGRKGQAATEYIIIAGFVFFALVMTITLLGKYGSETFDDITDAQLQQICHDVVDMSESVYYMGFPARQTKEFTFPKGIRNITIARNDPAGGCTLCTEIRFTVSRQGMKQYISCTTNIVINSSDLDRARTPGLKKVRAVAGEQGNIWLNWTS
ncbi:MAG: hypothetical protein GXP63_04615 [DPANN group archaeon]|nr:hypothetical protein [DPANN group archaeon]